jgi:hypothetical protein
VRPFEYWLILAALAVVSGWGFLRGFRWWRWARLIEDTPTSRIRSAAQGYVELAGTGRRMPGAPLIAPLSRTPCTWWSFTIERRSRGRSNQSRWRVVRRGTSDGLFELEDDSGRCVVDPEGAEVLPAASNTWYGDTPLPVAGPPPHRGFRGFGSDYRYRESRMHDGDPLYAIGWFHTESNIRPGAIDEEVAALLKQWKKDSGSLMSRFDKNRDGTLSLAEWEHARAAAHEQVRAERARHAAEPGIHILMKPRDASRPYLLAAGEADALARRYRLHGLLGLAAFLAGVAGLAWLLINAVS